MGIMPDIEHLNSACICITLDRAALCKALVNVVGDARFCADLAATHPHLISSQPLFLTGAHARSMQAIISAIESIARLPGYEQAIAAHVPEIARMPPGPLGVFMGYDFHLSSDGPKLIEINTNAGGALINAYLLGAQHVCCGEMAIAKAAGLDIAAVLEDFIEAFRSEWRLQNRTTRLKRIAIVDDTPGEQYLYPEFVLFQRLFENAGITAVIATPEDLACRDGALWHGRDQVDLVYNRLTDFDLFEPRHAALREAYRTGSVVVTPHPWAHAHLADKRNLTLLTDGGRLASWAVPAATRDIIMHGIPRTVSVTPETADALWAARGNLFFKPSTGYGSKATYRGDKLTRKTWVNILAGTYVAQEIVPPSARAVAIEGKIESLKADLRCYTYAGRIQMIAGRLYSGQTTNFRTSGGGFAPVFVSDVAGECSSEAGQTCG